MLLFSDLAACSHNQGEAILKQITLAAIFALGLSTAIAGQTIKTSETERALARLGDLAPDAVRRRLNEIRPPAYRPSPVLINEIIKRQELPVFSGERVERLKASLQPVLADHERDGKLPIYVLHCVPAVTPREKRKYLSSSLGVRLCLA